MSSLLNKASDWYLLKARPTLCAHCCLNQSCDKSEGAWAHTYLFCLLATLTLSLCKSLLRQVNSYHGFVWISISSFKTQENAGDFFYQHCTNIPGVKLKYCAYFGEYVVMINDYSYSNQLEGDIRKRLFSFRKINFLHVILLCHSGRNVTVSQRGLAE